MSYCGVVQNLLTILTMIFNKTDTLVVTPEAPDFLANKYLKVDELLQHLIVKELSADIGKVAQKLVVG